jgi:hypothetical protein
VIRNATAIIVGLAAAILLIFMIQKVGHFIYPPRTDLNINDVAAMRTYFSQLPLLAQLFPVFSYFIGAFVGPIVACAIGTAQPKNLVGIIGLILLALTISNLISIPHPHWFSAFAIAVIVGGAWLAMQLADRMASKP